MGTEVEILAARIAERLKALGITERAASINATGKPDTLRFIRTRGVMPSWPKIVQIADALQTTTRYLLGEKATPEATHDLVRDATTVVLRESSTAAAEQDTRWYEKLAEREQFKADWLNAEVERIKAAREQGDQAEPRNPPWKSAEEEITLPLHAARALDPRVFRGMGDRVAVPVLGVDLKSGIGFVRRPAALADKPTAYAFRPPDAAMAGSTSSRENLVVCDPSWPVQIGDEVAVHLRPLEGDREETPVLHRTLRDVGVSHLTLAQNEPPMIFWVPRSQVRAIHRVINLAEAQDLIDIDEE